jgi:hypothetical protein
MELHRFNAEGIRAFQRFLDSCTGSTPLPWPESILSDRQYSESIGQVIAVQSRPFNSRFELAEYLHQRFEAAGFVPERTDGGLWAWIGCFFFREICPKARGVLKPGEAARWIPQSSDWRRYYRHLVAGPYGIYHAHRDSPQRALAVLCQRPGQPGEVVEQLVSRQEVVTNKAIMRVATDWFVDPASGQQRRGAGRKGAGGARRFITVLRQFDVTWDLSSMAPEDLRARLPNEFRSGELPLAG